MNEKYLDFLTEAEKSKFSYQARQARMKKMKSDLETKLRTELKWFSQNCTGLAAQGYTTGEYDPFREDRCKEKKKKIKDILYQMRMQKIAFGAIGTVDKILQKFKPSRKKKK